MARARTLLEAAARQAEETPARKDAPGTLSEATKFPLETLRRDCMKLYGVTTSTFDGATLGMAGAYGIEEIRSLLRAWKTKEVICK